MERIKEKALLVALDQGQGKSVLEESLYELELLTKTAGAETIGWIIQKKSTPTPNYYLGKGKVLEIKQQIENNGSNLLIFEPVLSPTQQQNIEEIVGVKTIDRIQLILDIFAQHARTREGKLQVELAQLNYLLPRLKGRGIELSRLGGGIGTRGPGEQKLETDRRKIRRRIEKIKKEIEKIRENRKLHHLRREEKFSFSVALVGYTNAGKTTLLSRLTQSKLEIEDMLFTTLDPLSRKVCLPDRKEIIISDTVGFIKNLPPYLITAFRATLEEITTSDLIIHLINLAHPNWREQKKVVEKILKEIGAAEKPTLPVFNKIDLSAERLEGIRKLYPEAAFISALYSQGLKKLLEKIEDFLKREYILTHLLVPYHKSSLLNFVHQKGVIKEKEYKNDGLDCWIWLSREAYSKILSEIKAQDQGR